jgi:carboxylesterase
LNSVTTPLLIIHSQEDDLASVKGAKEVYNKVSSIDKELIILHDSYHMVLYDNEREYVFSKALEFFDKHSSLEEVAV